jgi:hypothetical protein
MCFCEISLSSLYTLVYLFANHRKQAIISNLVNAPVALKQKNRKWPLWLRQDGP